MDINTKLNSTPLFNEYQSFNHPQEIINNLIAAGKYQLLKEIGKMLSLHMPNNDLNSSLQIENKLSWKVKYILNNIKEYKITASKLNKNLSESLSSLNSTTSTFKKTISSGWKSLFSNKDPNR